MKGKESVERRLLVEATAVVRQAHQPPVEGGRPDGTYQRTSGMPHTLVTTHGMSHSCHVLFRKYVPAHNGETGSL
ncbi:MAG: hypothetical protein LBS86_05310 [Treponema sp.]|nr:hypothetical protein [Treponema sp.]